MMFVISEQRRTFQEGEKKRALGRTDFTYCSVHDGPWPLHKFISQTKSISLQSYMLRYYMIHTLQYGVELENKDEGKGEREKE